MRFANKFWASRFNVYLCRARSHPEPLKITNRSFKRHTKFENGIDIRLVCGNEYVDALHSLDASLAPNADGIYDQAAVLAGMWQKPIEQVTLSDTVIAPDSLGNLTPAKVDKLFTNTTSQFAILRFADGRDDLVAPLGHRFMTETSDYMEIGHMSRLGSGRHFSTKECLSLCRQEQVNEAPSNHMTIAKLWPAEPMLHNSGRFHE